MGTGACQPQVPLCRGQPAVSRAGDAGIVPGLAAAASPWASAAVGAARDALRGEKGLGVDVRSGACRGSGLWQRAPELCREMLKILNEVKFSLNVFSSFQESPKSTKSTTKPGSSSSSSSGKDGGAENSEEVRLSPWVWQCACAAHLWGGIKSFILAPSSCSTR